MILLERYEDSKRVTINHMSKKGTQYNDQKRG
jgi:hypothetical protein